MERLREFGVRVLETMRSNVRSALMVQATGEPPVAPSETERYELAIAVGLLGGMFAGWAYKIAIVMNNMTEMP